MTSAGGQDTKRIVVHLVHGTGAEGAPWTTEEEPFRAPLINELRRLDVRASVEFNAGDRRTARRWRNSAIGVISPQALLSPSQILPVQWCARTEN